MQQLIHFDKEFFKLVNGQWTNPFFDWIMPWLRNSNMWIPFYVFLGLLIAFNFSMYFDCSLINKEQTTR